MTVGGGAAEKSGSKLRRKPEAIPETHAAKLWKYEVKRSHTRQSELSKLIIHRRILSDSIKGTQNDVRRSTTAKGSEGNITRHLYGRCKRQYYEKKNVERATYDVKEY